MKNLNNILKVTHNNYFSGIFAIDASFGGNHCQFWKYIRAKRMKFLHASQMLKVNHCSKLLLQSFTNKDLSHIPPMDSSRGLISSIPNVTTNMSGIQHLLSTLNTNKACGPDHISPYILKHCAEEISTTRNAREVARNFKGLGVKG